MGPAGPDDRVFFEATSRVYAYIRERERERERERKREVLYRDRDSREKKSALNSAIGYP